MKEKHERLGLNLGELRAIRKNSHIANYSVIATNLAGFLFVLDIWALDKRYDNIIKSRLE
jgi:hypothetical protein